MPVASAFRLIIPRFRPKEEVDHYNNLVSIERTVNNLPLVGPFFTGVNPIRATLATDTASALNVFENWSSTTITITRPEFPVAIFAFLTGFLNDVGAPNVRKQGRVRTGISFDGGTTFVFLPGVGALHDVHQPVIHSVSLAEVHLEDNGGELPSDDVVVKAQLQQQLGVAGDVEFKDGLITVIMFHLAV